MMIRLFGTLLICGLMLAGAPVRAADMESASAFVDGLGREAIEVLRREDLPQSAVKDEFKRLFNRGFDVPTIGQFVLGRYWRQATDDQKRAYLSLFEQMVVTTYAQRFSEYSGQTLRVTGTRPEGDNDVLVQSEIQQPSGGPPVGVVWRVRDRGGDLQIIDVIVEGVSMAVTQRNEFGAIIQRNGGSIDALLDAMRNRASG